MSLDIYWPVLWQYREVLLQGFYTTLFLFSVSAVAALVPGILVGAIGSTRSRLLNFIADWYVELVRNTPLVVKLFFLYFGLGMQAFPAAILGLALHQGAYIAEIVRSGIKTVGAGQMEAGLSSGLTSWQTFRHIILPQAVVTTIPPLTSQILEVLKNSSIAMTITVQELTYQTQEVEVLSFRGFEAATAATLAYLGVGLVISGGALFLEWWLRDRRLTRSDKQAIVPMPASI